MSESKPGNLSDAALTGHKMGTPSHMAIRLLVTLAISALGGLIAHVLALPAAWLMGGSLAVGLAALLGVKVVMPVWLRDVTFVLTGLLMGGSVARDSLTLIMQWPVSLAALAVEMAIIIASTGYMLRKLFGLDPGTAYLSSFPGHLSFIMGIAASGVGDSRQIVIIQVIRIMMLTICVPLGAAFLPVNDAIIETAVAPVELSSLIGVGALCALVGFVFVRLRVPAGYVLGAMAASTAAKLGGFFDGAMPDLLQIITFILIGCLIGSRFAGITLDEFGKAALGGVIATLMTVGIVTAIALAISPFIDIPFGQIWLGLSPGALEGMGALGIALGYDTAFIAAHHVARLLMLTIAIPLVVALIAPRLRGPSPVS